MEEAFGMVHDIYRTARACPDHRADGRGLSLKLSGFLLYMPGKDG